MYTKNLYWRLLSLLLPRVVIGVAIGTVSSRYGSDLIVLWGGILIKIVIVIRLLRRRYLLLGLLVALHIVGLLGLLALHSAGLIGLLVGPLLGLIPPHPGLIDLISSGVIALLIVIIVVLLLVLIVVLLLVLIIALRLWLRIIIRLRMCGWLWLWLRLRLWVWVWHK